jgi:hypothetical protein
VNRSSLTAPAAATVGLLVVLVVLDRRLQATGGPGIIPFELAGPHRSEKILRAWGAGGQRTARQSLLLDFPFLLSYTVLNVRLTARAGASQSAGGAGTPKSLSRLVVAVQVAAGACDAIENAALLGVVAGGPHAKRLSSVARAAASAKFTGLMAGWVYGTVAVLGRRRPA